ncbi:AAA family ATPase [Catenovulum maritimum]|uniref:Shikimate kinase n=1 Tax=Catenovulum maritimum TaxID=1513271 RepID=A0A0J8GNV2_9ALTE|nr:AAA family ATPase [Catenovulum maritimum]KMT64462.1 shikimate kinase [Catenovulum maritimum]
MIKTIIFGNSGSGKSTLAGKLSTKHKAAHLDLDTLAWQAVNPPQRMQIDESANLIQDFLAQNDNWVIEGCYSDLLTLIAPFATQAIFMNLPVAACVENAKMRPWEPHKYKSKADQDANLDMLIAWISQYTERTDTFSQIAHQKLFDEFNGDKLMYTKNT